MVSSQASAPLFDILDAFWSLSLQGAPPPPFFQRPCHFQTLIVNGTRNGSEEWFLQEMGPTSHRVCSELRRQQDPAASQHEDQGAKVLCRDWTQLEAVTWEQPVSHLSFWSGLFAFWYSRRFSFALCQHRILESDWYSRSIIICGKSS